MQDAAGEEYIASPLQTTSLRHTDDIWWISAVLQVLFKPLCLLCEPRTINPKLRDSHCQSHFCVFQLESEHVMAAMSSCVQARD